jgi:DNA polymerase-3 subunit delta'
MTRAPAQQQSIFSWIREHHSICERLTAAARNDRVAQSYLFYGASGVGKTRTALGFAQALNCTGDVIPCGACPACRKINALTHPDVRLLFPATREEAGRPEEIAKRLEEYGADRYHLLEFARNASIGIERIRELKTEAAMSLVEGRRRVYILAAAHRMHEDAAQSALKLIEEPPKGTHLILIVEEPAALLPTIVSRCQQVRFRSLRRETIEEILVSECGVKAGAARLISTLSDGSLGRALGLREEESIERIRDTVLSLFEVGADARGIQEKVRQWARSLDPNTTRRNAELLLMWCHDLLVVKYGLPEENLSNIDRKNDLERQAGALSLSQIRGRIDALEEWIESVDRNVSPPLALHQVLLRVAEGPRN